MSSNKDKSDEYSGAPFPIIYTDWDIYRMQRAKDTAVRFMRKYSPDPPKQPTAAKARPKPKYSQRQIIEMKYRTQLPLHDEWIVATEAAELADCSDMTIRKNGKDGIIVRRVISNTRGGKYEYNTLSVIEFAIKRDLRQIKYSTHKINNYKNEISKEKNETDNKNKVTQ